MLTALTVPQSTLTGMWMTLFASPRQQHGGFATWLISVTNRASSIALLLGAMLLTINTTSLDGYVWEYLIFHCFFPLFVAAAIGLSLRCSFGMRLETVGPAGPNHNFTIVDLFACLTITGLAIAIFRNLPRISIAQQDISLSLILVTLVACFALYRGASETRYSFAAWCIMLIGFVISLPTLDVLFEVSTDSPWSWSWASSQYVRNRSLTYLSVFTAVWLTTKWLVRSGFVLKTNRRTSQG